jgi:hypothetical protein
MKNANTIFSILILAVLAAGVYFIVQTIRDTTEQVTGPFEQVEQANQALQTQVSQLMNPTPTIIPDPNTYINEVRALARLETIQYSVEKVITAEQSQGTFSFLFGDRLLFVAHGIVIAGIDMAKIQPGDMQLTNGVLNVRLPAAEVFVAAIDNQKSYVYTRETGILTKQSVDLETLARQSAEQEIRNAAIQDGILEQAERNAEAFLLKFFNALGYEAVIFTFNEL